MRAVIASLFLSVILSVFMIGGALADEGMWTFNAFPSAAVKRKYGFEPDGAWLDHVRMSSVRLAGGCSGSLISDAGLVMTNHHCASDCVEQLSSEKHNFMDTGFYAQTASDEVRCPDIEVNQLVNISDVTQLMLAATKGLSDQQFNTAQKAEMSKIEKECSGSSEDLRCDVVTLYHGGKYDLYKYRRFQDVRLVFAPEIAIAFFGGDPDNFNFPRYDLDIAFLRVYQDGKPLQGNSHFKWSAGGARENMLTFVSGHPGGTDRGLTVAELQFQRDVHLLKRMLYWSEYRGMLTEFQNRGAEQKRISMTELLDIENALKAYKGRHAALQDRDFFARKTADEKTLRAKVAARPELKKSYGSAWGALDQAMKIYSDVYLPYQYFEKGFGFQSSLYGIARKLVRAVDEIAKPNEQRFREFADSNLPAIKQELFSTGPIYDEFEIARLTFSLTKLREELGADDPVTIKVLGKKSPAQLAQELVKGTRLKGVDFRKKLFDGGRPAVSASDDPMIAFARLIDPDAREIRRKYEDGVESRVKKYGEMVAKARFGIYGTNVYPDATFTLRLSYGDVRGYRERGKMIQPLTFVGGAFARNTGSDPFALPESWVNARSKLHEDTPMNFCTTNDIIGGNSGSPVFDRDARIVGLIFDGNIQSLGGEYGFDETVNRAVALESPAILESLDVVYHADRIVREIRKGIQEK